MLVSNPNRCGVCCLAKACSIRRHFLLKKMIQLSTLCTINHAKKTARAFQAKTP
jgi:hypothetical protein